MDQKSLTRAALFAALISLGQMAQAEGVGHTFTPVECLPPEQRQVLAAKIREAFASVHVDWDKIVAGVDENGELALRAKSETGLPVVGMSSCVSVSNPLPGDRSDDSQDGQGCKK